ncbi:Eco57I restriction-modification methylase domain-containing protein [Hydrogenophaga defluvii]|uniref:site-specific DNA-methyltransferase (adenine-specific) n=1 Tax=Hydrogenophaga defluvii TaxID=249410 RepID=A0ABW2SBV3_9BURK
MTFAIQPPQFEERCPVQQAHEALAHTSSVDERGAIFTRKEVVECMLDWAGYTSDKNLKSIRILEPSCGHGEFLLAAIERLLQSCGKNAKAKELSGCIRAVELHKPSFDRVTLAAKELLGRFGFSAKDQQELCASWLVHGDFLLTNLPGSFDVVIGNPPYVRQELIHSPLLSVYRRRFTTLYDRADLYVLFIERSLELLSDKGQLCFICADRWMKNKYGQLLRQYVSQGFGLKAYMDMTHIAAFHSEVAAYPAITVIERGYAGPTFVAHAKNVESLPMLTFDATKADTPEIRLAHSVVQGSEPWLFDSSDLLSLVRDLERRLPTLEEAGCKVGIGVATGADKAFIGLLEELDVEPSRKLPLAMTKDIDTGHVKWRGFGIVNPFEEDGSLASFEKYPKFAAYLKKRYLQISKRHVAQRDKVRWYRTIDRITPSLTYKPKLLIPDIRGETLVAYETGHLYPHHNLYYVVSDTWDLEALQAILLSDVARLFIATYSTKMRGGFLRFQAQYLRRIRVPTYESISQNDRKALISAARSLDKDKANRAAFKVYGINEDEAVLLLEHFTKS